MQSEGSFDDLQDKDLDDLMIDDIAITMQTIPDEKVPFSNKPTLNFAQIGGPNFDSNLFNVQEELFEDDKGPQHLPLETE